MLFEAESSEPMQSFLEEPTRLFAVLTIPTVPPSPLHHVTAPALAAVPLSHKADKTT